ncbi:MAG: glucosamine-6-phosphate deaminase [Butyrivibrio sp.]|nr:glucosamine-6-phosphate deaminase [Butyrivibrio sp.]
MKIIRAKDYNDMSRKAANIISAQVIMKSDSVLGLATGATPTGTYKQLIDWYKKGDIDFSEVTTINLDEYRGLPKTHSQSYWYYMHENFFNHVNIPENKIHLPDGSNLNSEAACEEYEEMPRQAYTMGIKSIMQARKVLMIVNGESKADIIERALFGRVTPEVPASVLQMHPDFTIIGDEAAFSKI